MYVFNFLYALASLFFRPVGIFTKEGMIVFQAKCINYSIKPSYFLINHLLNLVWS